MSYHPRAVGLDPLERRDSDADNRRDALLFSTTELGSVFFFFFILLRLLVRLLSIRLSYSSKPVIFHKDCQEFNKRLIINLYFGFPRLHDRFCPSTQAREKALPVSNGSINFLRLLSRQP